MRKPASPLISAKPRFSLQAGAVVLVFFLPFLLPASAFPQGFGTIMGDKVVLQRKLPAVIHLAATSISVKTTSPVAQQGDAAQLLTELLQTNLLKYDNTLKVDDNSPNVKILCTITNFSIPPPQPYTRDDTVFVKGKPTVKKDTYYHVAGTLDVDMRVTDRGGRTLDSNSFSAKYSQDYAQTEQGGVTPVGASGMAMGAFVSALHSMKNHVKPDDTPAPTNAAELGQQLIRKIVALITPRLVNTDEPVEIPLAKGRLDDANKLATGGLWSRDLDTLETMTPFSNPDDDAYRFYNIGVANEALGYQAEDHAAAKNYLMEAAVNYGKAIDAKPSEKNFIDAQNRIEVAVTYYKTLGESGPKTIAVSASASGTSKNSLSGASSTNSTPKSTPKTVAAKAPSANGAPKNISANGMSSGNPPSTGNASPTAAKSGPVLTNEKVIDMFKNGVDEPSIIAAIHDAHATQFDLSPDGLIELAKNGVKGKILDAMRARGRTASQPRTSSGGE